jgi:hypothetical protein
MHPSAKKAQRHQSFISIVLTGSEKSIPAAKKLIDQMREAIGPKHYSYHT